MPRVSLWFFAVAPIYVLIGMGFGIFMGASQDFTLAPAHAHLNLIGWVTMALYGTFYALAREASKKLVMLEVARDFASGQNRVAWIAEREARPREALDPTGVTAVSTVVDGEHAHVDVALAGTDATVAVDLVFRNRTWLVEAFGMPGAPA